MQRDFASTFYLPHEQDLVFKTFLRKMRLTHANYMDVSSQKATAMLSIIDILEGWMPLGAGEGCTTIKAKMIGELDVHHFDGNILLDVAPINVLTGETIAPQAAFQTDDRNLIIFDRRAMAFAVRILRYVNLRYHRYGEVPEIEAWWTQRSNLTPSVKWITIREAALMDGVEAPRACHWMADPP